MTGAEWAQQAFKDDAFAMEQVGTEILDAKENYAKLRVHLQPKHRNAMGQVQGGVMFTLADFAFAVASGYARPVTVSLTAEIKYMSRCKGDALIATATCLKDGRRACFFGVEITDERNTKIAYITVTGFRFPPHKAEEFPEGAAENPYKEQIYFQKQT